MSDLLLECRHACRRLLRRPGFTLLIVLTLGVAVGASATIFGAVQALLLRPFPFADPDRLVRVSSLKGGQDGPLSVPELEELAALDVVEAVAGFTDQGLYNASGFGAPEELQATIATANIFDVLGVPLLVGAPWPASYDRSRQFALVISHGLWTRRFGQRPDIVGQTLTLDGSPGYVVHGVLPPGLNFPSQSDIFRSSGIAADPAEYERRDLRNRVALVRLRPRVSVAAASRAIDTLGARLAREFPASNAGLGFQVVPLRDHYVGHVRPYLVALLAGVGLVLLVACSNVANLLLSRALSREREFALRLALGASRARIVRQLLVESLMLAILSGVAGILFAFAGIRILRDVVAIPLPPWMRIELDGTVLAVLIATALTAGLAAGLVPALRTGRDVRRALNEGGRGSSTGAGPRAIRAVLIVSEVAFAVVLLIGAVLLARSVLHLHQHDPGFRTGDLLTFRVELGWRAYDTHEKTIQFHSTLLERLSARPGVAHAAFDSNLALSGKPREPGLIAAEGQSDEARQRNPFVQWHTVSAGFFETLGVPLAAGRAFTELDLARTPPVVIVSERLAARLWPGEDPLGKRLSDASPSGPTTWMTVVGVAGDVQHQQIGGEPGLDVYRPLRQRSAGGGWFVLRTRVPPQQVMRDATSLVGTVDPQQSYFDVQTMRGRIEGSIWERRAAGTLFVGFALLAVALAVTGLYGVLSYVVSQRRREFGVRVALGAQPADLYRLVLGGGLRLTAVGLALGTGLGLLLARAVSALVFGLSPFDPLTFTAVPILIAALSTLACYIPARRATQVDPTTALRAD